MEECIKTSLGNMKILSQETWSWDIKIFERYMLNSQVFSLEDKKYIGEKLKRNSRNNPLVE